jgi:hypothetical protein
MFLPGWAELPRCLAVRTHDQLKIDGRPMTRTGVKDRLPGMETTALAGTTRRRLRQRSRDITRTPARQYLIELAVCLGKTRPPFVSATELMDLRGLPRWPRRRVTRA